MMIIMWWYDDHHVMIWWSSCDDMMIIIWQELQTRHQNIIYFIPWINSTLVLFCFMMIWWSSYDYMMIFIWGSDDDEILPGSYLTKTIWFEWFKTSYSGCECHRCRQDGTGQRTMEDRATRPMDAGWLSFAKD